jgi:NADP-dependent 3-hydroxy acid dehydrogenase YdfG
MARKVRSIAGRPAMITGAASGIGRSLARRLSRSGSPVAIADIDEAAVFNNAGVAVASPVLDADPGGDDWLRQVNFDGVVNGTRAFLPILVGPDAYVFDTLARVAPTHYYDVMAVLETRLRARPAREPKASEKT